VNTSLKEILDKNLPALILSGVILMAVAWYICAFVLPNHPSRPPNVPKSATLVFVGFNHYWQECWFDGTLGQDRCRIYGGGGDVLRDDVFLDVDTRKPVQQDELEIVQGGGADSVRLKNSKILLPQANFDAIRKQMKPEPPSNN
jgi:hypothetical protein